MEECGTPSFRRGNIGLPCAIFTCVTDTDHPIKIHKIFHNGQLRIKSFPVSIIYHQKIFAAANTKIVKYCPNCLSFQSPMVAEN